MLLIDKNHSPEHKPLIATIGFFDGVHLGHRYLIEQVETIAKAKGLPSAVITFPVHPRLVLQSDYCPALLCGYEEKLDRLASTGIDYCVSFDFTEETSKLSAHDFIHKILKEELNVDTLVIGYDHRFGHNRRDGFEQYVAYGKEAGIDVIQAQELGWPKHVSSSRIRSLLSKGDIGKASEMLSYNYTISGKIVEGFKVGRTIGFPTANIQVWENFKVIPAFGVYAVYVHIEGQKYGGMLYIGKRPTLQNGDNISLEVNIFDFDQDIYNKTLTVEFIEFVRPDEKFANIDELKAQITNDKHTAQSILKKKQP
ncbi:riboflavin kinase/FMN adenylyltransferase [Dysgonomonas sp. PH5-45]|uniref:riboflavin biosynthesis protein RibF n=1 Tax=unclassified Dysgonomonas TaxID=2630389 RepID=UPI002474722A|nr:MULTISPECIES: riboflavin biosynthesis protein RibF [unclassified Dysgonomonas]MDH6354131.1 riboflavin kinase/FMN adenylyltransferase [Dysgonomonas sp. PH5-45]MDH6387018.1 riboflavin kinase/FMN adenylyltransferase [Dysgonomonas sp. PH5-37]